MAATARAVDLSDVKEGGNFRPRRKVAGDYVAKVVKADDHQPSDKSKPMGWVLTLQVRGDARSTYPYYLSPEAKQAWRVRTACVAAGLKVPQGRIRFDPNKLVGKEVGIELEDDEYNGREKSSIADMFPVSEVGSADEDAPDGTDPDDDGDVDYSDDEPVEDEPEPAPAPKPRRKRQPEPEPEEDEEYDDDPEPTPPPRRRRATAEAAPAPARRRKPAPAPEPDDDDLDDLEVDDL